MNLRDMEETEGFYRTLCSLETLRSGAKGFFHDFSESARQAAGEQWLTKVFGRLINDEQRIRTIFTDTKVAGTVLETLNRTEVLYRGKDATASRARRLEGFQAAAAGERRKALLLFSQAVLRAPLPGLSGGENPQLPSASALLKIEETETAGKRAIAADCIDPGDRLVVEPPYAATLLPEFFGTHCHHCFDRFKAPVGCPDCSSVAFCNRKCRDTAVASYHKYECKILALLIGSGMSVLSMLALRMATQCQVDKCLKISNALNPCKALKNEDQSLCQSKLSKSAKRRSRKKKLQESRREQDQNEKVEEDEIDMKVYDLVSHEKRRTAADFFERSLMAAFLLKCLQRVGFFESPTRDDEIPNEEEIAIGGLLLRHLQLLQFNAHEVFETRFGAEHRFRGSRPNYIGVAIYPTVARFNHDCYPAVTRYFIGRSIVIRATRSLQPGDVVAENYGPIFTKRSLEERRKTLTGRYWFYCECKACRENWPRFEALTNDHVRLRCPTEGCSKFHRKPRDPNKPIECPSCRRKVELRDPVERVRECEESYARGFAAMEEEKPEKALEIFFEALKRFHSVAVPPHKDTHLAEIAASACMADEGNVYRIESL
ncbi:SET and MYND domain-containing protein 4-like isoform X2 [Ceratina calcarata]|uniref:SET and MYND domain-containing protein 4-like isoform X2 n=1 Tax=Ceratina calcarata TaxID=156304 RepID=A0AAJ7W9A3_9HYME|nr:SET and MYND domain-containing protein 4-like isoform X2 [Ceratina calcarata]